MIKPTYGETLEVHGVKIPYVKTVISDRMTRTIERGRYEAGEINSIRKILRPNDKVLELGAEIGVVSTAAAQTIGGKNVVA
ncbi:MAG: hypothetical protein HN582_13195 [Marinovum sp.]|jgi:hypothetical protein|nr:hypothetical protein [Marinovum sp.]MBT6097752.1 hypothetical protein [Marinovum sp.]MBT6508628.1 hypothetical protein [Marinovum sp.]MBT7908428.1 hypothetical protein [Marinovum sp.]MDG2231227.1 hypothetical protein [Paracoccaceae bacterium]